MLGTNLKIIFAFTFLVLFIIFSCTLTNKRLNRIETNDLINDSESLYRTELPVHAHLDDGGVVILEKGFQLYNTNDSIFMFANIPGIRYSLDRQDIDTLFILDYTKVIYVEVVEKKLDVLAGLLSLPGVLITSTIAAVAIFGSCPTVYSMADTTAHLEAECFSYSINPRFEMQDVDKLEYPNVNRGILKLELRNEALETHYINTFKILTADHNFGHKILPKESLNLFDWKKEVIELGPAFNDYKFLDKLNNDITGLIELEDDIYYSSNYESIEEASKGNEYNDWITMELNLPVDQSDIYLGFKLRSTLLNTVFLYDLLLDKQNFGSIDWTGETSQQMWYAYNFAKWYHQYFGLHIEVMKNDEFVEVDVLGDSGPIVWSKLGVRVPLYEGGVTKIRFKFITDNWHIDWIGASLTGNEYPEYSTHEIERIERGDNGLNIKEKLSKDDDQYLITYPGHSYTFLYDVGNKTPDKETSYLLQAKGFYIEWLRKDWLLPEEGESYTQDVKLEKKLITDLFEKWECEKATMEDYFFETMIPVTRDHENGE